MTKICLIRHGQTDWNKLQRIQGRIDNPINMIGSNQAKTTGLYLKKHDPKWDVIMCSPLSRTIQTAEIIAQQLNYQHPIIVNPNVIEREFGEADGVIITPEVYQRIINDDYKNLEITTTLQQRARNAIIEIGRKYPNQKVLIVTHSHFIKGLFTTLDLGVTFTSPLYNGSLSYITIENDEFHSPIFNIKTD
ncbi:MAG TPA: histidine phosphatase family protein [Acholeplasmataceae bacterium]|nr:histidine phosphatase family protein [Acholeplasmataceae bacterium]